MFDLLVADPPWAYRNVKTGGSHQSGSAQKYPVLTLEALCALPVASVMAPASVCALWATTPLGADPYQVLAAWGFTFKTKWYWHKVGRKGTGYWTRGEVEEVLLGVRGTVAAWRSPLSNYLEGTPLEEPDWVDVGQGMTAPRLRQDYPCMVAEQEGDVLHYPVAGHSVKPEAVQDRLEALMPTHPRDPARPCRRLELFATRQRPGWTCVGLSLSPDDDVTRDAPNVWTRLLQEIG